MAKLYIGSEQLVDLDNLVTKEEYNSLVERLEVLIDRISALENK